MVGHCHACTAPLNDDLKGVSEIYCKFCSDEQGNLHSFEQVQQGIVRWFKMWQGDVSDEVLMKRAESFMKGLPAWADE